MTRYFFLLSSATVIFCASSLAQKAPSRADLNVEFVRPAKTPFEAAVIKAGKVGRISYRVGFGSAPGEFHQLVEDCLASGKVEDFEQLLFDKNPVVRVLGLICLARSLDEGDFAASARLLFNDEADVEYDNGCVIRLRGTVGQLARMLADGKFLPDEDKYKGGAPR